MILLLVFAFVLSGAAGLIYESIWSRYLGLFVGHSAYAQNIVLVIFLGGMSLGALIVGGRSDRIKDPLLAYAIIEVLVGALSLGFHPAYVGVTGFAYDTLFPALAGTAWLSIAKWGLAGALILPQSILLGATFPLMSAAVVRRVSGAPGRMIALLYFANSIGAAVGALVSGFYLVAAAGLPGTVAAAAMLNLLVGGVVVVAIRSERSRGAVPPPPRAEPSRPERTPAAVPAGAPPWRLLLAVSLGTAVASFIYEIAWIRMLSLVLGSATHAFELMLSAFILGLALGAFWVRSRADTFRNPLRALGVVQWAMGSLALATLPLYLASFHWMAGLMPAFHKTDGGYQLFSLMRYGICLAVMLPATFCAGITLPLITRTLLAAGSGERAIGMVYGVNTLGSILGAGLAGLLLLPLLGLKGLLVLGAAVDVGLGVTVLAFHGRSSAPSRRLAVRAAIATTLLTVVVASFARFDRNTLTSGVYRHGLLVDASSSEMLFYRDGRTATVSVRRVREDGEVSLATNGKPDASLSAEWFRRDTLRAPAPLRMDQSTQVLLALVTLAHAPRAATAAVIGQGSGMTSHFLLGSPQVKRLVTIEIEPEMLRASRQFMPVNRRVFDDVARSTFAIDDAKSYFAAGQGRYDLILSEPSNPWVSGVSGLFTTEFYRRVRRHLTPDGVFGQWLHLYEINDDLVLSVLAAIHQHFASYEMFLVDRSDLLIVATNRPSGLVPDWSVVDYPGIADDLRHVPRFTPPIFEATRLGNRAVFAPLLATGPQPNSDFFPTLDLGTEKARFLGQTAAGFIHLHGDRFSFIPIALGRAVGPYASAEVPTPEIPRVGALAFGARVRQRSTPFSVVSEIDRRVREAHGRRDALDASIASGVAPVDWAAWTRTAMQVEEELHIGTSGYVDESYFRTILEFMSRQRAPRDAVATVAFVHDLASWNLPKASREADTLIALTLGGQERLPPEMLLDGAVAAKLLSGDKLGAERTLRALLGRTPRGPDDLRTRLVVSHLRMANPAPSGPRRE